MNRVRIFDTTLRDGEQAPGFSMTEEGKLRVARALAALRVDVIEAGFAAASPGDARAIAARGGVVQVPFGTAFVNAQAASDMQARFRARAAFDVRVYTIGVGTTGEAPYLLDDPRHGEGRLASARRCREPRR